MPSLKNGIMVILFGIMICLFMFTWIAVPLLSLPESGIFRWIIIGFAFLGVPPFLLGIFIILMGILTALNLHHTEIRISDGILAASEKIRFVKKSNSIPIESIESLEIRNLENLEEGKSFETEDFAAGLTILGSKRQSLEVPGSHPRSVMLPLAHSVAEEIRNSTPGNARIEVREVYKEIL